MNDNTNDRGQNNEAPRYNSQNAAPQPETPAETPRPSAIKKLMTWKVALFLIIGGLILLVIGWEAGGRGKGFYIDLNGIHITTANGGSDGAEDTVVNERSLASFHSVDISTSSINIELIASDHYGLEIRMPSEYELEWSNEGGCLTVQTKAHLGGIRLFNFNFYFGESQYIKVYYPKNAELNDVSLKANSGNIKGSQITARELSAISTSGNINLSVDRYNTATLKANSGEISFTGTSGDRADLTATSGNIHADIDSCGIVQISANSGNIAVNRKGSGSTAITAKATSGNIRLDGNSWTDLSATANSGEVRVFGELLGKTDIKTTSGNTAITVYGRIDDYGYSLTVSSGNISVDGSRMGSPATRSGSYPNHINAKANSGNIRLEFN